VTRDLLFEIGVEELPGGYVPGALEQLERAAREGLTAQRLNFAQLGSYGTPRRLALWVSGLADRQSDFDEEAVGPAAKAAFDADGKPARALLGFCSGKGVDPSQVRRIATPRRVRRGHRPPRRQAGGGGARPAARIAARASDLSQSMRWIPGDDARFARPVRWLVALFGNEVIPARAYGSSRAHLARTPLPLPAPVDIPNAGVYLKTARARLRRGESPRAQATYDRTGGALAAGAAAAWSPTTSWWTTASSSNGRPRSPGLRPAFPGAPREVIVTALREHQRFFAVEDGRGAPAAGLHRDAQRRRRGLDQVRRGNEDVLAARLEDARFYWETDLKHAPAERVEQLAGVVWIEGLGSLRDKASRLETLCGWLAARLAPAAAEAACRAALLCKTDLMSEMIGSGKEYAGLQGVIGGYYAQKGGEPQDVADAIYWHYHPRFAGDLLPQTDAGLVLSIADKLDHVAGSFVAGKAPSGSEDPPGCGARATAWCACWSSRLPLDLRDATMQATARSSPPTPTCPRPP
jgi:glycyl-tRNA synthetase beta chain